jgi:hypothetical protein
VARPEDVANRERRDPRSVHAAILHPRHAARPGARQPPRLGLRGLARLVDQQGPTNFFQKGPFRRAPGSRRVAVRLGVKNGANSTEVELQLELQLQLEVQLELQLQS